MLGRLVSRPKPPGFRLHGRSPPRTRYINTNTAPALERALQPQTPQNAALCAHGRDRRRGFSFPGPSEGRVLASIRGFLRSTRTPILRRRHRLSAKYLLNCGHCGYGPNPRYISRRLYHSGRPRVSWRCPGDSMRLGGSCG